MIPNGTYLARALGGALGKTNAGKPQVAVEFEILSAEAAGEHITWYGFFSEKTEERTIKSLRLAGWRGDDLSDLSSLGGDDAPEVALVIEEETYEGKTRTKVQWVNAPGAGLAMKSEMSPEEAKAFATRMKGRVAQISGPRPAPTKSRPLPPRREEPPPVGDDDIPF